MSMQRSERLTNAGVVRLPKPPQKAWWNDDVGESLYWSAAVAIIASYAQMFQCLRKMDEVCDFGLVLPETIATFRAGCILQGFLLNPMTKAFEANPDLSNLIAAFEPELKVGLPKCKKLLAQACSETSSSVPVLYTS